MPAVTYSEIVALADVYFKLDETTGTTCNNEESGGDGVYTNMTAADGTMAALVTTGGTSQQFVGSEHVSGPVIATGDADQTLACVIKTTDSGGYAVAVKDLGDTTLAIFINADGTAQVYAGDKNDLTPSTTVVNTGAIHHIAATYNATSGDVKLYIDGVLEPTDTPVSMTMTANLHLMLSCRSSTWPGVAYALDCTLDEVLFIPQTLTDTQVATLAGVIDVAPPPAGHFVSPTGGTGTGEVDDPWSFEHAITNPGGAILAGDTVWMRAGTHTRNGKGDIPVSFSGTSGNPITFRSYPGERATLDLHNTSAASTADTTFYIRGNYLVFRDIEFTSKSTVGRYLHSTSPSPPWVAGGGVWRGGMTHEGDYNQFIHCVFHDLRQGFFQFSNSGTVGAEIYGCIIYNNGWLGSNYGHGHGFYLQNDSNGEAAKRCITKDCVVFSNFGFSIQCYGDDDSAAKLIGMHFIGNACYLTGAAAGGGYTPKQELLIGRTDTSAPSDYTDSDINVEYNYIFANPTNPSSREVQFGWNYGKAPKDDLTLKGNYFAADVDFDPGDGSQPWNTINSLAPSSEYTEARDFHGHTLNSGSLVDASADKSAPYENQVFVRDDEYETGWGWVTVFNWSGGATISANLSTVLADGDTYQIIDTARYDHYLAGEPSSEWGHEGTFSAASPNVSIDIADRALPEIYRLASDPDYLGNGGYDTLHDPIDCPKEFGCFQVVKTGVDTPPPATNLTLPYIARQSNKLTG